MKYLWILLIAFAFAFLAQGDSLPFGHRKEQDASTVLPFESEVTKGDFIGRGPVKRGKSPYAPQRGAEKILPGNKDGIISSKMENLSRSIGAGKSYFKIMALFLKSRPDLVDSLIKISHDGNRHPRDVKNSPTVNHGETVTETGRSGKRNLQREGRVYGVFPKLKENVYHKSPERDTVYSLTEEPEFGDGEETSPLELDPSPKQILQVEEEPLIDDDISLDELGSGEPSFYEDGQLSSAESSSGAFGFDNNKDTETSEQERAASEYASAFEETFLKNRKFNDQPPPLDDFLNFPEDDEDGETKRASSRQQRAAPEYGSGYHENSNKNNKMDINKVFAMPVSGVRWKGFSMAHAKNHDGAAYTTKDKSTKGGGDTDNAVTALSVVFMFGGSMFVFMMGVIFIFVTWPIRKYFQYLLSRTENEAVDVESGEYGDELSSIRVDRSYPTEWPSSTGSVPYSPQYGQTTVPSYQTPGNSRGMPQSTQAKGTPDKSGKKSPNKVSAEDKKRDCRNAERRKIIRMQSSQKRDSLVSSLLVAKTIIDGHAQNKDFEKKASERRHKIKQFNSFAGERNDGSNRRKSFADEVQNACSVILPNWDDNKKMEQLKEKCRKIKNKIADKRRTSLLDEIQVAMDMIVGSENNNSNTLSSVSAKEF